MAAWPPNNGLEASHLDRNVLDVAHTQSYKNMTCIHRHKMVASLASDPVHLGDSDICNCHLAQRATEAPETL